MGGAAEAGSENGVEMDEEEGRKEEEEGEWCEWFSSGVPSMEEMAATAARSGSSIGGGRVI